MNKMILLLFGAVAVAMAYLFTRKPVAHYSTQPIGGSTGGASVQPQTSNANIARAKTNAGMTNKDWVNAATSGLGNLLKKTPFSGGGSSGGNNGTSLAAGARKPSATPTADSPISTDPTDPGSELSKPSSNTSPDAWNFGNNSPYFTPDQISADYGQEIANSFAGQAATFDGSNAAASYADSLYTDNSVVDNSAGDQPSTD